MAVDDNTAYSEYTPLRKGEKKEETTVNIIYIIIYI